MTDAIAFGKTAHHDIEAEVYSKNVFGFWLYLMTDCILFSCLFATFVVLHDNTFGGPSSRDLFSLPYVLGETLFLLVSSFTSGLIMMAYHRKAKKWVLLWFLVTFLLGLGFLVMELTEFTGMVHDGNSWQRSGFLTSYFVLVGTHGAHITVGLFWMIVLVGQVLYRGLAPSFFRRLTCFKLFWHFLDIVWIFIFTIVYLFGVAL